MTEPWEFFPELIYRKADFATLDGIFETRSDVRENVVVHVDAMRMANPVFAALTDPNAAERYDRGAVHMAAHYANHAAYWRRYWRRRTASFDVLFHAGVRETAPPGIPGYNTVWRKRVGLEPKPNDKFRDLRRKAFRMIEKACGLLEKMARHVSFLHVIDTGHLIKEASMGWFLRESNEDETHIVESFSPVAMQFPAHWSNALILRSNGAKSRLVSRREIMFEDDLDDHLSDGMYYPLTLSLGGDGPLGIPSAGKGRWRRKSAARMLSKLLLDNHSAKPRTPEMLKAWFPACLDEEGWATAFANHAALAPRNLPHHVRRFGDLDLRAGMSRVDDPKPLRDIGEMLRKETVMTPLDLDGLYG